MLATRNAGQKVRHFSWMRNHGASEPLYFVNQANRMRCDPFFGASEA